jgi:hypothetical protein
MRRETPATRAKLIAAWDRYRASDEHITHDHFRSFEEGYDAARAECFEPGVREPETPEPDTGLPAVAPPTPEAGDRLREALTFSVRYYASQAIFNAYQRLEGDEAVHDAWVDVILAALAASPKPSTNDRQQWTLDNIYTIARRESQRHEDGKDARPDMWGHLIRLCEAVGCQARTVGVLRAEPSSNATTVEKDGTA